MAQVTDQTQSDPRDSAESAAEMAGLVLAVVAEHFTAVDPTAVLEPHSLLVCISAESYELAGRSIGTDSAAMSLAALSAAPELPAGITRGEAALRLRRAAEASGYDWSSDDNERVIPVIPDPRREPQPKAPGKSAAMCCGRPMRRDGQQLVCRKCGAWTDQGGEA